MDTHAVSNISMTIHKGDYASISGPSGSGKSTLLSILGILDTPTQGSYKLNGFAVHGLNSRQQAELRNREIGFIFQSFNLISDLTVRENVELPLNYGNRLTKAQRRKKVDIALERIDIGHRQDHFPWQLSGGQQQRVAVARALVGEPSILLADEPTGNLDSTNAQRVMDLLDVLHHDGATICLVTHDPKNSQRANRHFELLDGALVRDHLISLEESG